MARMRVKCGPSIVRDRQHRRLLVRDDHLKPIFSLSQCCFARVSEQAWDYLQHNLFSSFSTRTTEWPGPTVMLKSSSSIDMPFAADHLEPTTGHPMTFHSELAIFTLKISVSIILLYYYDDLTTLYSLLSRSKRYPRLKRTLFDDDETYSTFIHFRPQK